MEKQKFLRYRRTSSANARNSDCFAPLAKSSILRRVMMNAVHWTLIESLILCRAQQRRRHTCRGHRWIIHRVPERCCVVWPHTCGQIRCARRLTYADVPSGSILRVHRTCPVLAYLRHAWICQGVTCKPLPAKPCKVVNLKVKQLRPKINKWWFWWKCPSRRLVHQVIEKILAIIPLRIMCRRSLVGTSCLLEGSWIHTGWLPSTRPQPSLWAKWLNSSRKTG